MTISKHISDSYIAELNQTIVDVQFSDKVFNGYPCFSPISGSLEIIETKPVEIKGEDGSVAMSIVKEYCSFRITINNKFINEENQLFSRNQEYLRHINSISSEVGNEIDQNINLRLGKWDILDFLSVIKLKLNRIRSAYYEIENSCPETNLKKLYKNPNIKLTSNDFTKISIPDTGVWVDFVLSSFWVMQMNSIDRIVEYIKEREIIIEKSVDYVKVISEIPVKRDNSITWEASDTDMLEVITALVESGSIQNPTKSITRKEAIEFFSDIFNVEIKDAESKLSRATERKKDVSPFLTKLKENFDKYARKKDERNENIRK